MEKEKALIIKFNEEVHKQLKHISVEKNIPMSKLIIKLVEDLIKKESN